MGYTASRGVVKRNLPQLKELLEAKSSLYYRTNDPRKFARYLREAIHAAGKFEEFEHFAELRHMYMFKEIHEHPKRVEAIYIGAETTQKEAQAQVQKIEAPPSEETITHKLLPKEKKTIPDAISILDVLGFVMKLDGEEELFFPNAKLREEDREKLYNWTQTKGEWKYIDHDTEGLTLTKKSVPEVVIWKPESEEGE